MIFHVLPNFFTTVTDKKIQQVVSCVTICLGKHSYKYTENNDHVVWFQQPVQGFHEQPPISLLLFM